MWYENLVRPLFFHLDPEQAHYAAMGMLEKTWRIPGGRGTLAGLFQPEPTPELAVDVLGLHFAHPVGLAAGFDKDARWLGPLGALGFSFVEIGTVTPRPQPGNPKPRLFRLPEDKALINRLGFNNQGAEAAAQRVSAYNAAVRRANSASATPRLIIGGNIGKNKDTPNEQAVEDYRAALRTLHPVVDYFVVNVSSPNTPGLRELQEREPLTRLLETLQRDNGENPKPKPILLKIAPDLTEHQLDDIAALVAETRTAGLVCTNTTLSRHGLHSSAATVQAAGAGGLSGDPLRKRSDEVIAYMRQRSGPLLPIIGVGGIRTAEHIREKMAAGANLVQVYTGFVYEGPAMVQRIVRALNSTWHNTIT
jgi:dihydroorotate dehydrogenase